MVAKIQNRYSEHILHVPADISVIVVSLSALASAGVFVLAAVVVIAAVGMVVFSA